MSIYRNHLPIMGASGQSTGYEINQSIKFDQDNNASLQRTPSSAGNRRNWTFSVWFKESLYSTNGYHNIFAVKVDSNNFYEMAIRRGSFASDGSGHNLQINNKVSGTNNYYHKTDMAFLDPTAWYHLVAVADTPNQIPNERMRLYVNGVRITSFETNTIPAEDYETWVNSTNETMIGNYPGASGYGFDGYMAEINLIDGYSYGPEYFGEFKEDTDIWIPKEYTGSYGTNGFYITGENINVPGENKATGNTYASYANTAYQTHDQSLDSPTNNFCTPNPLDNYYFAGTFKDGMTTVTSSAASGNYTFHTTTMKVPETGKWYAEVECDVVGSGVGFGISEEVSTAINSYIGNLSTAFAYYSNGQSFHEGGRSFGDSFTSGDIIGIAVDMDNKKIYYSKNGTFQASGNPAGNSNGLSIDSGVTYFFAANDDTGASTTSRWIWNFGQNPMFSGGTSAGGNKDSNGRGNFKYSVPSGFLAVCTKNLGV